MGLLPVPDEVRSMHDKIDRLVEAVSSQATLLRQILARTHEPGSFETDLKNLQVEMEHVRNSVTVIKDCVRLK